ncbi:phage tail protein [Phyllobacterium sp. K27]
MKIIRTLCLAAWFMLAAMTAAYAEPISGLIGLLVTSIGSLGALGQAILGAALSFGSSLLQRALTKKQTQQVPGIQGQIQVGGDNPLSFIVGTYATAGQLEYVNTGGDSGKTPNAYLTQVITVSDIPVTAILPTPWINGEHCTISDTLDPGGRGNQVDQYRTAPGSNNLFIIRYLGTQTAADPFLLSQFGSDTQRPWTSDMIGRGLAYAIVTAQINRELFTGPPQCRFEVQGIALYDPRKDSTVGGSGTQRRADPATWTFSDNPAVVIYNILIGNYYGTQWIYGLQNLPMTRLPLSNWFAAMNECDRIVGGVRQFRCGAEIRTNEQPLDVINELLKSCNGRMAEIGGIYKIRVGAPTLPVYAFTDETISVTDSRSFDPFPGLEGTHNGVQYSYPEPEAAWEMKDAPVRLRSDLEAQDDGRRLIAEVDFNYVPFPIQAQVLAKALIETNRKFRKHKATLPPEAYDLEPLDVISWTSASEGYSAKLFDIESMDDLENVNQAVAIREVDPSDYDWNPSTDPLPSSVGFLGPIRPAPQPMVAWFAEPSEIEDNAGNARRPAILLSWDNEQPDIIGIEYQTRNATTLVESDPGRVEYQPDRNSVKISHGIINAMTYGVRGRYIPGTPRETLWSGWMNVTTFDIRLGADDVYLPGMVDDVLASLNAKLDWIGQSLRFASDARQQHMALIAEAGAQSENDKKEIKASVGNFSAQFSQEISVVATQTAAAVLSITELNARMNDPTTGLSALASITNTLSTSVSTINGQLTAVTNRVDVNEARIGNVYANGILRFEQIATQAGALSSAAMSVSATSGGPTSQAAIILNAISGGLSEALVYADRFAIIGSGSAKKYPLIFQGSTLYLNDVRANNLEAISSVLGNVDISNAIIGNLIVGTSNLGFRAVTANVDYSFPQQTGTQTTWTVGATATTQNPEQTPVFCEYGLFTNVKSTQGFINFAEARWRHVQSGDILKSVSNTIDYAGGQITNNTGFFLHTTPALGTNTYVLEYRNQTQGAGNFALVSAYVKSVWWKK